MLVPYLLTAVFGLIAGADLSMYSSGLNLITGGIRISRSSAVAIDAVLITVGGLYITVVAKDFYGPFTTFLTLLAVPLTAWAAVFLIDMIERRDYDEPGLTDTRPRGVYWYRGGFRTSAFFSWFTAIVMGVLCTHAQAGNTVWFTGPLAGNWIGRNSLGWLVAGITGAVLQLATGKLAGERTAEPAACSVPAATARPSTDPVEAPHA
jgi:NCS1 family nucleobase:cation symporter-1